MSMDLLVQIVIAFLGAYVVVLWLSLITWTYRDTRSRSSAPLVALLAVLLVLIFNFPGLILYFILRPRQTLSESYERSLEEEALLREIDEQRACPTCKLSVEPDFLLCPNCCTQLKQACPQCGRPLNLRWGACPYCGARASAEIAADRG